MPVKKFEAKTIKEALALVKNEFGPDAVILSAKDLSKSHGLAGEKSVQVTAAISDGQLQKKRLAEQALAANMKESFRSSSASQQKQFINSVNNYEVNEQASNNPSVSEVQSKIQQMYSRKSAPKKVRTSSDRGLTKTHYMDIKDDPVEAPAQQAPVITRSQAVPARPAAAKQKASIEVDGLLRQSLKKNESLNEQNLAEVNALKKQIDQLQKLVSQFQNVPQNFVSLHPGANEGLPYETSDIYSKLINFGFEEHLVIKMLKEACEKLNSHQIKNRSLLEAWVAQYLMSNLYLTENLFSKKYNVFIGGSGQGKTTTLLKTATLLNLNYRKSIAIVSLDNSRVGVVEQLRTYAQILNVPFVVINHASDWELVHQELAGIEYVLVDTPSCNKNDYNSINDLKEKIPKFQSNVNIHYVQSLLSRRQDCFDQAQSYLSVGFSDVIFTHLDDSSQYGLIYNFQKRFDVPVHSFGIGPKVPEDYEPATKEKFVDLIFNLSGWRKN